MGLVVSGWRSASEGLEIVEAGVDVGVDEGVGGADELEEGSGVESESAEVDG